MLDRIAHQLSHRAHIKLTKYVELVSTDGLGAERQAPCNVVNGLTVGDQAKNRQFALRQSFVQRSDVVLKRYAKREALRDIGAEKERTGDDSSDGVYQKFRS